MSGSLEKKIGSREENWLGKPVSQYIEINGITNQFIK